MKKVMMGALVWVLCGASPVYADRETAVKAGDLYAKGITAENNGRFDMAKACYEGVLALQPKHGNAQHRLLNLKTRRQSVSLQVQKRKLEKVIIPEVNFNQATLSEAIAGLSDLITQAAGAGNAVNFVIDDPKGLLKEKKFNIQLRSVPAAVVLKYINNLSSSTTKYDEYAVVIRPLSNRATSGQTGETLSVKKENSFTPEGGSRSVFDSGR